jgi:hypothetical protein
MKRAGAIAIGVMVAAGALAACSSPPTLAADAAPPADANLPDAPPPDALPPLLGPALVLDDLHIAGFTEDLHAFSLLGEALNPQLMMAVQNGQLLIGLELRELDDPSGQSDPEVEVGFYTLQDGDDPADPSDNFDQNAPELYRPAPGSIGADGVPAVLFSTASIGGGQLHAEGVPALDLGIGIPLPFQQPTIDGQLGATGDGMAVKHLSGGRLRGAVPAQTLAFIPNPLGTMCGGAQTLLDVFATGCGLIQYQPEVDLDGDGLERLYDDAGDTDAGTPNDGRIDRCVDGDGTEILGVECVMDARIQDGYRLIFVIHGVRAYLADPSPM